MNRRVILLAFPVVLFFSCNKDNNNSNNNEDVTQGTWRISLFTDSGNDETSDFTGYLFTFGSNGVLTTVRSAISKTGTWSRDTDFTIDLGAKSDNNKPLGELTDDWKIISITSTEIKLTDDNSSGGELLTFTRN